MGSYGLPYQGSKNGIAKWVVENIPCARTLVDLMCGGCAVTHAAMESGRFDRFVANDITEMPLLFKAAIDGEFEGYSHVPSRDEFHEEKACDIAVSVLYSFGNNRTNYLWGDDVAGVKEAASKMISAPSIHERRMAYRRFIDALAEYGMPNDKNVECLERLEQLQRLQGLERLERLQRLQGLERLQGLQGLQGLERLQVSQLDYRDVGIPLDATVYCDPPYRGTNCEAYKGFDFDAFDGWLAEVPFMVVVSEYTRPQGCSEVASIGKTCTMNDAGTKQVVERLFVQDRFVGEYRKRMKGHRLF